MKRLGMYTGHIYEEDEIPEMKECGRCITEKQAQDPKFIAEQHIDDLLQCVQCGFSCPKAQESFI